MVLADGVGGASRTPHRRAKFGVGVCRVIEILQGAKWRRVKPFWGRIQLLCTANNMTNT